MNQKNQLSKNIEERIRLLARRYADDLKKAIALRMEEMKADDRSHVLIYQVLGINDQNGKLLDEHQNQGRFLYNYAGRFLEDATKLCFLEKFPDSRSDWVPNIQGKSLEKFGIDCLVGTDAIEIKWRDATTDGDHRKKERARIRAIIDAGYTPIRVMFYYPNRNQAIKIQKKLETLYKELNGHYYYGEAAWMYVKEKTGVDLLAILKTLAQENAPTN